MIGVIGRRHHIVIDCPDPSDLATFYSELLGLPITFRSDDWVVVSDDDTTSGFAFQLAPNLIPPQWPDPARPQQFHLDVMVDDLDTQPNRSCWRSARVASRAAITSTPTRQGIPSASSNGLRGPHRSTTRCEVSSHRFSIATRSHHSCTSQPIWNRRPESSHREQFCGVTFLAEAAVYADDATRAAASSPTWNTSPG